MRSIEIFEEVSNDYEMVDLLRHIADQIEREGYTSGYHPGWELQGEIEEDEDDVLDEDED